MSMLGGLAGGGDSASYSPQKAPHPPKRSDNSVDRKAMQQIQKQAAKDSYATALLGGSAPTPTSSYSAKLFSGGM
jgi:hypothetical protein